MRVVVVTTCTGTKRVQAARGLTLEDFRQGPAHVARRERTLPLTPAQDLYAGQQHQRLMRGIRAIRASPAARARQMTLDLWILSAGYGVVAGTRRLAPYEATFQQHGQPAAQRAWARQLTIPQTIRQVLAAPYTLAMLLLGETYLDACALDEPVRLGGPTILFCAGSDAGRLAVPGVRLVGVTRREARRFSCGLIGLKGELAARLLEHAARDPRRLADFCGAPADAILSLLDAPSRPQRAFDL